MFTTAFLRDLAERVVATFAEAWAALLIADGTGILDAHWTTTLSVAGMAALVTALKGVAAVKLGDATTGASALSSPPPAVTGAPEDYQGRHREGGESALSIVVAVLVLVLLVLLILRLA